MLVGPIFEWLNKPQFISEEQIAAHSFKLMSYGMGHESFMHATVSLSLVFVYPSGQPVMKTVFQ